MLLMLMFGVAPFYQSLQDAAETQVVAVGLSEDNGNSNSNNGETSFIGADRERGTSSAGSSSDDVSSPLRYLPNDTY